jgi:hypothetical protein
MNRDPRPVIASLGVEILEIPTLHDRASLAQAYGEAFKRAQAGHPTMIYPVGFGASGMPPVTVADFGRIYGIEAEVAAFAKKHNVALATRIVVPGSLMSFRDSLGLIECVFYVNNLPGGEGQHDGGMKGRDGAAALANPMLAMSPDEQDALKHLRECPRKTVVTQARPPKGAPNLVLTHEDVKGIQLPGTDKWVTPRAGSESAYVAVAKKFAEAAKTYVNDPVALHLRAMNMLYEGLKQNSTIVIVPSSAVETMPLAKSKESQQRLLEVIQHDVKRLDRLISDISDASRLDAELQRDERTPVDLTKLLNTVISVQNETRKADGTKVSVTFEGGGPLAFVVPGHDSRLGQVINNLIDNARSFAPPDSTVRVTCRKLRDAIEIVVDDDGPGIRPEAFDKIFERFYTDRPEHGFGQNSGLGLSISKQIIEAHRGRLWAENRTAVTAAAGSGEPTVLGARFTVRLPTL